MNRFFVGMIAGIACFAVVAAPAAAADKGVNLGEIVVTSSGYEEDALDYPGNVTVVTKDDIARTNARSVYEVLQKEAGIYITDYSYTGKTASVDMRGFGDTASRNVLVMIDGRRINEIDISATDWSQIPIESIERVEIVRGAGSVLYGDNAAAGVINIITKKGEGAPTVKYEYETGSYRFQKQCVTFDGKYPFMQYAGLGKYESTDGFRLNGGYEGYDYDGNLTLHPTKYLSLYLSMGYHKDWYGLPAGLSRTEIDQIGRSGSTTPDDWAKTESGYLQLSPKITATIDAMTHTLEADMWLRKKRLTDGLYAWGALTSDASQINTAGGSFRYLLGTDISRVHNELLIGTDVYHALNRLLSETPAWFSYNQLKIKKDTCGIYATDKIVFADVLVVNAGVRQEWAEYVFDQEDTVRTYETRHPDESAVEIGVEYKYHPRGAVYGRFTQSFRFPATDEFYSRWVGLNTNLSPQRSDTWEVGIKEERSHYLRATANVFWMHTQNEIFYDPLAGGIFGDNNNYDRTKRVGLELGLTSDPAPWLHGYFNYTYLAATFDGGTFAGNRIPMVPRDKISCGVSATAWQLISASVWSDYVGYQFPINDQFNRQPKLKAYFVTNAKVTLSYKGWEVFGGINNIFDTTYSEIATASISGATVDYFPAPERNFRIGASCRF